MKRILLVVLLPLLLIASACGGGSEKEPGLRNVKLMLDWTPNTNHTGFYVAQQAGYYEDAGLDVEILQPGEQGGLPSLGTGDVDFAVSVQESLLPARAEGVPAVSVATLLSTNTSSLVSLKADGINRPKDLEGKKYGGFGGPLEKQLIDRLVSCDGGDPAKVNHVEVGDADYRVGLEQNRFDFAWVFNGWDVVRMKQQGVDVNTISFSDHFNCIPDWYTPLLATSESKIANDPEMVRDFMSATARGYADAISTPSSGADALLKGAPELDASLVRASSEYLGQYYAAHGKRWGQQEKETWVRFDEFLRNAGLVEKPIDIDKSFTNDFLPR